VPLVLHSEGLRIELVCTLDSFARVAFDAVGFFDVLVVPGRVFPILFLIYSNAMLEKDDYLSDAVDTSYVDDVCMVQMSQTILKANTLLEE